MHEKMGENGSKLIISERIIFTIQEDQALFRLETIGNTRQMDGLNAIYMDLFNRNNFIVMQDGSFGVRKEFIMDQHKQEDEEFMML
ncbi:hypothetical protein Bca4012_064756 [Brassica carinata]